MKNRLGIALALLAAILTVGAVPDECSAPGCVVENAPVCGADGEWRVGNACWL